MRFAIRALTHPDVDDILGWRYPPPYERYDMTADMADEADLRASVTGAGNWFAVEDADAGDLVAFLDLRPGDEEIEFGLGLRPELTGRGLGASVVEAAMTFAAATWGAPSRFALDVFPWNERAIRAYAKAGFVRGEVYIKRFEDGAEREFLRMTRPWVG